MLRKIINVFIPITLFIAVCFYCSTTLIEMIYRYNILISGLTKFIIIPIVLIITVATKWMKGSVWKKIFFALAIIAIIFSSSISDTIFLGQPIAYIYSGQDAGFEELYLFHNGKCKITYGGLFGVNENHYGIYKRTDSTVLIDSRADISYLTYQTISVGEKKLKIEKHQ